MGCHLSLLASPFLAPGCAGITDIRFQHVTFERSGNAFPSALICLVRLVASLSHGETKACKTPWPARPDCLLCHGCLSGYETLELLLLLPRDEGLIQHPAYADMGTLNHRHIIGPVANCQGYSCPEAKIPITFCRSSLPHNFIAACESHCTKALVHVLH